MGWRRHFFCDQCGREVAHGFTVQIQDRDFVPREFGTVVFITKELCSECFAPFWKLMRPTDSKI